MLRNIALVLLSLLLWGCNESGDPVLHDTQGKTMQLTQLHGKWVVINFWAGWCEACVEEIPQLNHFYRDTLGKDVVFYGASLDDMKADDLAQLKKKYKIDYPVLVENAAEAWGFGTMSVLPTTFILNPEGKIMMKKVGANTEESLLDAIAELKKLDQESKA